MEEFARMDGQGRIYLPASIRQKVKGDCFIVEVRGDVVILKPLHFPVEKFYGIARPAKLVSAEEIDEAVKYESEKAVRKDIHRR
ncbi:MAG: transcriptional regulator [Candidatus Brockarchaeota archaeon]|nr:transcriptional regulator [Candidatus Brockarchaeota archaeon]